MTADSCTTTSLLPCYTLFVVIILLNRGSVMSCTCDYLDLSRVHYSDCEQSEQNSSQDTVKLCAPLDKWLGSLSVSPDTPSSNPAQCSFFFSFLALHHILHLQFIGPDGHMHSQTSDLVCRSCSIHPKLRIFQIDRQNFLCQQEYCIYNGVDFHTGPGYTPSKGKMCPRNVM